MHVLSVIWILAALALAGPAWDKEPAPFADDDAGLVVLLKVSGTMQATDVQPSRLARAKHKLRDLMQARKGLSTGLIAYSGSAHLVMPLTRDDRIVSAMVEDLTPELMPADGDALAEALEVQARHSGAFMATPECRRGAVGAAFVYLRVRFRKPVVDFCSSAYYELSRGVRALTSSRISVTSPSCTRRISASAATTLTWPTKKLPLSSCAKARGAS